MSYWSIFSPFTSISEIERRWATGSVVYSQQFRAEHTQGTGDLIKTIQLRMNSLIFLNWSTQSHLMTGWLHINGIGNNWQAFHTLTTDWSRQSVVIVYRYIDVKWNLLKYSLVVYLFAMTSCQWQKQGLESILIKKSLSITKYDLM